MTVDRDTMLVYAQTEILVLNSFSSGKDILFTSSVRYIIKRAINHSSPFVFCLCGKESTKASVSV